MIRMHEGETARCAVPRDAQYSNPDAPMRMQGGMTGRWPAPVRVVTSLQPNPTSPQELS